MIKTRLLLSILLFNFIFSLPSSAETKFEDTEDIRLCLGNYQSFDTYKLSLQSCFVDNGFEFSEGWLAEISEDVTDIFEIFEFSNQVTANDTIGEIGLGQNTLANAEEFISDNPSQIYNFHQNIKNYLALGLISPPNADVILTHGYNVFDPVKLSLNSDNQISENTLARKAGSTEEALSNASGGLGTILAILPAYSMAEKILAKISETKSIKLSISSSSTSESSGSTITLTATASPAVTNLTSVNLTVGGDASSGSDYSAIASSISIPAGSTSGTTTFTITDDSVYEGNESINISIDSLAGVDDYSKGSATSFTIIDDESAPTVTLASSASSVAENAGSSLTLTATLSQIADENVTVSIATSGTSTEGADYASVSDITISAGSSSGTSTFTPSDDSIYEGDETAIISIDSVSGADATESGTQSETITITENESAPTLSLSTSASSVAENGSPLTLTATLSVATDEDVSVTFATSGTATSGTDYAALSLTVSAGDLTGTTSFTPSDDVVYEGDETAIIDVDSVSGGSATESGTQQVTITINENESAPTVTLSSSASSVDENGSALTLTATLSVATTADVTIALSASGSATEGTDYENLSNITVSAGSTTGTTSFTPTDDSVFEGDETATIDIDSVSGGSATESGTQQISITIAENEDGPGLTIADVTTADESAANATFTVTMSPVSASAVTVDYATSDGTATAGSDYTSSSGTLTFSAGDATKTLTVPVLADAIYEGDETAIVTLSNVSGATIDDATATLTITDDESAPTVTLSSSASSIAENAGSSITLTATLSTATTADVTVTLSATGTSTEGTDYSSLSSITISAGSLTGTTTFTPTDDSTYEGNETAIIAIDSVSGGSATESGTQSTTVTITENESAPSLSISSSAASIAENSSSSITITATLSVATTEDVIVSLATSGTASSSDYSLTTSITISAGNLTGTTTLSPTDDAVFELDETVVVDVDSVSGGSATESGAQQETITITNDEAAVTVSLSSSSSSISEDSGSSVTITATLSGPTYVDAVIALGTSGTATEGSDYSAISDITISAGSTTGTTSFTPIDDSDYEADETATIAITSSTNSVTTAPNSVTITISEDETTPTVELSAPASSITENSGSSITLTATMSGTAAVDVTVALSTSGTATEGTDYSNVSDITISAGDLTGTASFTPTNDSTSEGDETATIEISSVTNADESGSQSVSLTITDDESTPTVSLSSSAGSVAENGSALTLTATLSVASSENVTVTLTGSGTSTAGTDYESLSAITVTAGQLSGTTSFTPTDDSTYEGNETAIIAIYSVSGGSAVENGNQSTTITITEDDSSPTVTLSRSAASIAENAGSSLTITATLSIATTEDVTVTLSAAGTGTEGSDYTSLSNITVSAGDLTGTTSFTPLDDSSDPVFEDSETAVIDIASVSGGSAAEDGTQQVTITITENESLTVTLSGTTSIDEKTETATITATASVKADATMSVSLSTAGTATSGTDYASLSNISISAGTTSGTTTFTPTNDTDYEGGSETAVISINSITGITASAAADTVTITITNKALNSGTQLNYNSATASSVLTSAEFANFNNNQQTGNGESAQNPLEVAGFHKAAGYGLTGNDKVVHVVDSGFDLDHNEFSGKTITRGSNSMSDANGTITGDHGLAIMGIIGANADGSVLRGGAPGVDFHVTNYDSGAAFVSLASITNDTNNATTAVVQNNSWGYNTSEIDEEIALMNANNWTNYETLSNRVYGTTTNSSFAESYINALDSFQDHGVVVFSNSNCGVYSAGTDTCGGGAASDNAEITAALPELFPDLAEAFISAVNVEIDGTAGNETYTLISAPCGDAGAYCMAGDGYQIATLYSGDDTSVFVNGSGTSYVAPQISAAVAILAEAFPNQTPEQWTDRLLASANNNIGYTHVDKVVFGNGVEHGYSNEAGHGILDVNAALNPITTSSYSQSIYAGAGNLASAQRFELGKSGMQVSQSFGDGLRTSLANVNNYSYDALGGGFKYNMSGHVSQVAQNAKIIDLNKEFAAFGSPANDNLSFASRLKFDGSVVDGTFNSDAHRFVTTVGSASPAIQSFFEFGANELASYSDYDTPYLTSKEGGAGVSYIGRLGDTRYFISYNKPVQQGPEGNVKGKQTSAVFAAESNITSNASLGVIGGSVAEDDAFLGLEGTEAFTLEGADSRTSFIGSKFAFKPSEDTKVSGMMTFGSSSMSRPDYGILSGAENVKSSSFGLSFEKNNVFGNDTLAVSLSQPNRVDSGSMDVKLTNLSDSEGNLTYTNRSVSIAPSGRQKDLGVSYRRRLSDSLTLSSKLVATRELNHVKTAKDALSGFMGFKYGNFKFGSTSTTHRKGFDAQLDYSVKF